MSKEFNLQKWNSAQDGPLTESNMEKKLRAMGYRTTQYVFPPGTDFPDHTHSMTKMDAITSGKIRLGMYGKTIILEAGDIVEVPKNTVHNATVIGSEDAVFFDSTK